MKKLVTKGRFLIWSVISIFIIILWEYFGNTKLCTENNVINYDCLSSLSDTEFIVMQISAISIFFSSITYFMREEIFIEWWNFARWVLPVVVLANIMIFTMPSNGGFFNMDGLIYLMVLAPLYSILILGSLWKIIRAHLRLKKEGK